MTFTAWDSEVEHYELILFVTGMSISSMRSIENIKSICEEFLKGRYSLKIIDINKNPDAVGKNDIIASPTLIKKKPLPIIKMVGDLSDRNKVLKALGITDGTGN